MHPTLYIFRITNRGLFSEINKLLVAIHYCEQNRYHLKIELEERSRLDGRLYFQHGFEKYFEWRNIRIQYNENHSYQKTIVCGGFGENKTDPTRIVFQQLKQVDMDFETAVTTRRQLVLTPTIMNQVQQKIAELNLPENFVFMHIRRGDKLIQEANFIGFDEFFQTHIDSNSGVKHLFIASDDCDTIMEAKTYLKENRFDYEIYTNVNSEQHGNDTSQRRNQYFTESEFVDFMTEMEVARLSSHVYCTFTSNVGRYLALLKEDLSMVTSLDIKTWHSG